MREPSLSSGLSTPLYLTPKALCSPELCLVPLATPFPPPEPSALARLGPSLFLAYAMPVAISRPLLILFPHLDFLLHLLSNH